MIRFFALLIVLAFGASAQECPTLYPAAANWWSNIVSIQSSTCNPTNRWMVNSFVHQVTAQVGLDKFYYINPRMGDAMLGSLMSLVQSSGLAQNEANSGSYVAGDYTPTTGLVGNGTSKYADTRINLRTIGASTNSVHLGISQYGAFSLNTTRFQMGASDGANEAWSASAIVNSGTIHTGLGGAASVIEYPTGKTNGSITGFLVANDNSFAIRAGLTSTKTNTGLWGVQGIANDGTNEYDIDSATIVKLDYTTRTTSKTNSSPFSGGPAGLTHLGDGGYYNGYLYIGSEAAPSGSIRSNACILKVDITNLVISSYFYVSNVMDEVSACEVDGPNNVIYAVNYNNESNAVHRFDLNGVNLGDLTLKTPIPLMQGITVTNGFLFISSDTVNNNAQGPINIFAVEIATGTVQQMVHQQKGNLENEGLMIWGPTSSLVCQQRGSSVTNSYAFTITLASSAGQHSTTWYQDGVNYGMPALSVQGIPNASFLVGAANNGGPVVFSDKAYGCTTIGKGLTDWEVYALSSSVVRLDKNTGRR